MTKHLQDVGRRASARTVRVRLPRALLGVAAAWLLATAPALAQRALESRGQEGRAEAAGDDHGRGSADHETRGAFCSTTAETQFAACQHQTMDDFFIARTKCINVIDRHERADCFEEADRARADGHQLCRAQRRGRLNLCDTLGQARYNPTFDPADFESDYANLATTNAYFPLTIGYRWEYAGGDETNVIEALNETKLIEGVTCIVLKDLRYDKGELVEATDDWYGQRKNGSVDFCGEMVLNFETFPGDRPVRPEVLDTHGQWKTGRDRDPSGTYILGSPAVGDVHRQEFSPGNAEDAVVYLSTNYGYGVDRALDRFVPRALVDLFCADRDCWVTAETTPIEPGTLHHKFYARGVGFILEVSPTTGDVLQLVGCNFDSRCASLPPVQSGRMRRP
jgi:hypothetical protein